MKITLGKQSAFAVSPTGKLVQGLRDHVEGARLVSAGVAGSMLSMESISDVQRQELNVAGESLSTALEAVNDMLGLGIKLTEASQQAAVIAGLGAGDYRKFLQQKTDVPMVSTESMHVVQAPVMGDVLAQRSFSLEAYNEVDNRNAVIYSIAYNMQSARQDEFGETFFPTLVITPDNVGFGVSVNLMMVYDGVERKITGTFEDFKKKNIIRAVADPSVLKKDQTKVVPFVRAQNVDKFVDAAVIAPHAIDLEGETITTAPLAIGKKVDLLGVSYTDALLASGVMDQTDTLDPTVSLTSLYATIGANTVRFNVQNLYLSNFVAAAQNNYRVSNLNFQSTSILLKKGSLNVDGSALAGALAGIDTDDLIVRIEVQASGNVNIETGELNVFGNAMSVHSVQNAAGELLPLDVAPAQAIVTAIAGGSLIGYDVLAYRANVNRRQRGQLIDVTRFTQLYNVPLRSPITAIHPITSDGQTDATDVQALITTTRIRVSNEAVTSLLQSAQLMHDYVDSRDAAGVGPDILGVGRFFVRPTYYEDSIDMNTSIDSIKSHERAADMQAVLVNKIRDLAFRMYRDSEYKAAADALAGGIAPTPTVIIGTDPVLARYLIVNGDLRTLGGEFDVRIVSTLDYRVQGKIFIAFSTFDESRNVAPNPMNFGNMVWAPELVLTANISRGNTISKETVVQPRYLFVTNCPVLAVLTVTNVPDVLDKVPLFMHSV